MNDVNQVLPDVTLRFHIKNPNLEECYASGYEAAQAELTEETNPFAHGSINHAHWLDGWWDGFYNEQPAFELAQDAVDESTAANEYAFHEGLDKWIIRFLEITSVIAVSALVGYQLIDLVA